jgi:SAM-dependent methyltransferase
VHWLEGYEEFMWSDTVADRTEEVAGAVLPFLEEGEHRFPVSPVRVVAEGEVAGITYEAAGDGTPVVLLPLGLSARQWGPLLPYLRKRHCTIVLGGPHLQPVENLEARGAGRYANMALDVLRLADPEPGQSLIEVGCGSGALLRRIVRDLGMPSVVGLDVNPFLLREARGLARQEGLDSRLVLREGSAEAIPFPDASFDVVFSSTVMEEVDADRMVAELVRIARPGGRVAVIVRAVDRGTWTNVPLSESLKEKIESSGSGGVAPRGCADATLYGRLHEAGLTGVRGGPAWAWVSPDEPWWDNVDRQIRGGLNSEEAETWGEAVASAHREQLPIWVARPFHSAVGTRP